MNAHLITVGDELLIGQVVDTNSAWIGQQLSAAGIHVKGISSVPDDLEAIQHAMQEGFKSADLILMTGGLGPTKDDITKKALADYYDVGFVFHQETFARIQEYFQRRGLPITEAHREQCLMPQNAELLTNDLGSAPGMWFEENGKILVSMPGVPYEMKHIVADRLLPRLYARLQNQAIFHHTIITLLTIHNDIIILCRLKYDIIPSFTAIWL